MRYGSDLYIRIVHDADRSQAFISLEKEIEDELPLFQELVVNLRFVPYISSIIFDSPLLFN